MIATITRTSNNIYVLSEIENEKCCLGKEDESWLWHKKMGHIHFDNLVKVSKREAVREMPQIAKPTLYAIIVNKESKQRPGLSQKNIQ